MNENTDNKMSDDCPLCDISNEAINKLNLDIEPKQKIKKSPWKRKFFLLLLILTIVILGGYKLVSNFSPIQSKDSNALTDQAQNNISEIEFSEPVENISPSIDDMAPQFTTKDIDGNTYSLDQQYGKKPVLLTFWATWCAFCKKELPILKEITEAYKDKIQVAAIFSGESKDVVRDYIKEKNVNFLALLDESRDIWLQYYVRGTPTHFLIDQDGMVVGIIPGFAEKYQLEALISMIP